MITIIVEVECDQCELVSNYVVENKEEIVDRILDDGWIVNYDDNGDVDSIFCCLKCQSEFSEEEIFDEELDEELDEDLRNNGMHIERF